MCIQVINAKIQNLPRACKFNGMEVGLTGFFDFNIFSKSININKFKQNIIIRNIKLKKKN